MSTQTQTPLDLDATDAPLDHVLNAARAAQYFCERAQRAQRYSQRASDWQRPIEALEYAQTAAQFSNAAVDYYNAAKRAAARLPLDADPTDRAAVDRHIQTALIAARESAYIARCAPRRQNCLAAPPPPETPPLATPRSTRPCPRLIHPRPALSGCRQGRATNRNFPIVRATDRHPVRSPPNKTVDAPPRPCQNAAKRPDTRTRVTSRALERKTAQ